LLVLYSFGSAGRFGLTWSPVASQDVVDRDLPAAHCTFGWKYGQLAKLAAHWVRFTPEQREDAVEEACQFDHEMERERGG
jgi:hypothetical protein